MPASASLNSAQQTANLEAIGLKSLDEFIEYFNKGDALELAKKLHFPHVRMAGNSVQVWQTPEDYARDSGHEKLRDKLNWGYSAWDRRDMIQADPEKIHFAVTFSRFTPENKKIVTYESFYIITKINERWGIQFRSSYAGVTAANSAF